MQSGVVVAGRLAAAALRKRARIGGPVTISRAHEAANRLHPKTRPDLLPTRRCRNLHSATRSLSRVPIRAQKIRTLPQPARRGLENGRDSEVCGFWFATARTKREDVICDQALCDHLFAIGETPRVQEPQTSQSLPKSVCPLLNRGFSTFKIVTGPDSRPDLGGAPHEVRGPRGQGDAAVRPTRPTRDPQPARPVRQERHARHTKTGPSKGARRHTLCSETYSEKSSSPLKTSSASSTE